MDYCQPVEQTPLPKNSAADFKKALAAKKAHSAPGPDSWRVTELRRLPDEAWQQLAELMDLVEQRGELPEAMTHAWMADLAKDSTPTAPLSIRPISLTSTVYRVYIAARTIHLQTWSQSQFHKWQKAYISGRAPCTEQRPEWMLLRCGNLLVTTWLC